MGHDGAGRPLRVGLLLDSYVQPQWVRSALERLQRETSSRIVAVALNQPDASPGTPRATSRVGRWVANRHALLRAAHARLDAWKFPVSNSPFLPVDIAPLLDSATTVPVRPRRTQYSDYFPDDALAMLRACDLDVAIRLGFRILRGEALQIARFGVWSYHHGDKDLKRGGPPAFWEVFEQEPTTGAMLQVLSEQLDDGRILAQGWVRTDRFSTGRNAAQLYWMAEPFLARAIAAQERATAAALSAEPTVQPTIESTTDATNDATTDATMQPPTSSPAAASTYSRRLYRPARNAELYRPLAGLASRYVARHLAHTVREEQWFLAYDAGPPGQADAAVHLAPYRYKTMEPPPGFSWADPFPYERGAQRILFLEEYRHGDGRGRILAAEIGANGAPGTPSPVLDLPYHLAYPFAFSYKGEEFLIPECGTRNAVEVWRARSFPGDWTLEHSMLEGAPWVDATLFTLDGQWILQAGLDTSAKGHWDELYVFFSDSPFGPWRPHRRNPVVVDVRSARPAGRVFRIGERLFRPAQDGSNSYGSSLRIQEITALTEQRYAEHTVAHLVPAWAPRLVGTHTFNRIPGFTIIDARREARRRRA